MKRFLITFLALLMLPGVCFASEYEDYLNEFDLSSFEILGDEVNNALEYFGISGFDFDSVNNFSLKSVFTYLKNLVTGKLEGPLESCMIIISIVLLSSVFKSISAGSHSKNFEGYFMTLSNLVLAVYISYRLSGCLTVCYSTITLCADFIYAFFPAFCIIVSVSGNAVTSESVNSTLLLLSQGINYIAKVIFLPLIQCFFCISVCSSVREDLNLSGVINSLKNVILKAISTVSAVFVSILSIKTAVASKADALGLRSMRFAINSVVPVIGSSISEGLLSIQSYSSLIKTSVGVVGIIAVALIFIPSIVEVVIWRAVLSVSSLFAQFFSDNSNSLMLKAFGDSLLIINVILILMMVTTVISIGILIAARGAG